MSELTTHEVLVQARNLISDEGNWTQNVAARDSHGVALPEEYDPDAVSFCAGGAIGRICGPDRMELHICCRDAFEAAAGTDMIGPWNDKHTHAEVLAAFDKAIAAAAPEPNVSFLTDVREVERVAG